ncbi:uncharacterized protein LOC116290721 [Actinia tenebrosa]|uniref:Uncharacterized protein LOC116290721 n=1 Tax=Actinia tenebrosa TaxID=6105 RepID=A0A6P8HM11_ACTTE|nr:uncharacterized protein LOC116290721 [Actinia tenebrosa]
MVFLAEEGILLHVVVPAILFVTSVYSGSVWPSGWYGLPQPKTGCPSSSEWGRGWWYEDRRLNCQSTARVPQYSHLIGTFNQAITKRYFCIKKKDNGQDNPWPNGQYCIYKGLLRTCPPGFVQGSIGWKNKDAPNDNHHSGMVPSGVFSTSTRINYCCKVDGSKENSISLPVNRPFLLLAYNSSECQSVKWARTTQEYLRFSVQEKMTFRGFHPFVDDNYALRYCYYENSNKTLTASQGTISRYLNQTSVHKERHTAWCIKPYPPLSFQFLFVRFTRFTFHASNINNYLEVLDGCNESAPSLGRFSSTQSPLGRSIKSSTNQVFVILQFGDRNGTYDFEFDYHIIPKVTTAATTLPLTSSSPYALPSSITSQPYTSSDNVTSPPTTTPKYLRYHDNNEKRKLVLSITLPIVGLVVVLLVLSVWLIRGRRRRRRYSRMEVSVYESEHELEDDMDGYFEEIQLSTNCSLLQLTGQQEPGTISNQASNESLTSEQELFIRHQHHDPETESRYMDPSTSTSETNQYELDPAPFLPYYVLDNDLLANDIKETEL